MSLAPLPPTALPAVLPRVEIVEPAAGAVIATELTRGSPVKLRLENAVLTAEREGVLVALDGARPRRFVEGRALTLGDLVPRAAELSPGRHTLLAVAVGADGRALRVDDATKKTFSLVTFFVGERPSSPSDTTFGSVFCLSPVGTFYSKPDESLVLDVLSFGFEKPPSVLLVQMPDYGFRLPFDSTRAYAIRGLPRGDIWLSVDALPSSTCALTLNPPPEARP